MLVLQGHAQHDQTQLVDTLSLTLFLLLPKLTSEIGETLEAPISAGKCYLAIASAHLGKVLGPANLSLPYYKAFKDHHMPYFLWAFNSLTNGMSLLVDSLREHITVLPKQDKDSAEVS